MADERSGLDKLADIYLEELYNRLLAEKILVVGGNIDIQNVTKSEINSTINDNEVQKVFQELNNLRSVAQTVYLSVEKPERPPLNILSYFEYFNDIGVTKLPLEDESFNSLIKNINHLNAEDISGRWFDSFRDRKISFRNQIGYILEFFSQTIALKVGESLGFSMLDPRKNGRMFQPSSTKNPDFMFESKDKNKLVLFEVKFRDNVNDLRSLVLREIEKVEKYFRQQNQTYLVLLIYTNQQDHHFDRLMAQFTKIIIEHDETLLNKVFLIPIVLFKVDDLDNKIIDVFKTIKGLEVDFDYTDSPLKHGWEGDEYLNTQSNIFIHQSDPKYGRALDLNLPNSEGLNYIDFNLIADRKYLFQKVTFIIQPRNDCKFYIEISVKDDKKKFWFQIQPTMASEISFAEVSKTEYLIRTPCNEDGNWKIIDINVRKVFDATFKNKGLLLNRIEGVRFRGKIVIGKIAFE